MPTAPLIEGQRCRIALLIPADAAHGQDVAEAWAVAGLLTETNAPDGRGIDAVFALEADATFDWRGLEARKTQTGPISLRRLAWQTRSRAFLEAMVDRPPPSPDQVAVPDDGLMDFLDCYGWIVFGRLDRHVAPLRPVAVWTRDWPRGAETDARWRDRMRRDCQRLVNRLLA